jgi:hypothetical protein
LHREIGACGKLTLDALEISAHHRGRERRAGDIRVSRQNPHGGVECSHMRTSAADMMIGTGIVEKLSHDRGRNGGWSGVREMLLELAPP